MADLEKHAIKRDRRFLVRLVLLLVIGTLAGVLLFVKMTSEEVGTCAAGTFGRGRGWGRGRRGRLGPASARARRWYTAPMLGNLDSEDRLRLMRFICSFAWADLEIQDEERSFVAKMSEKLGLTAEELDQVRSWLEVPPPAEELDPSQIPREHRQLFLDAARAMVRRRRSRRSRRSGEPRALRDARSGLIRRVRILVALTLSFALGLASACSEQEEDAPAASEGIAPSAAPGAVADDLAAEGDEEEELELAEGLEGEEEPVALDEMDQAMLETACFEGRQDACDRLGH